ncbi:MAG: NUMOD4 domain-containing protein [bacterium]|nr:NUMOD4 domain-containing protein [bacterium]
MLRNLKEPWKDYILSDLPNEIWKECKDYEGIYLVSNLGRVKSLKRIILKNNDRRLTISEKIKHQYFYIRNNVPNSAMVTLSNEGINNVIGVSILVGKTFLGDTKKNEIYCHLNKNPFDNRLSNISIMSRKKSVEINIGIGRHKFVKDFITNPVYLKQRFVPKFRYFKIEPTTKKVIESYTRSELIMAFNKQIAQYIEKIGRGERQNNIYKDFLWERKAITG